MEMSQNQTQTQNSNVSSSSQNKLETGTDKGFLSNLASGSYSKITSRIFFVIWAGIWLTGMVLFIYQWIYPPEPVKYIFYDIEEQAYIGLKKKKVIVCSLTKDFEKAAKFVFQAENTCTGIKTFKHVSSDFLLYTEGEGRIVQPAYVPINSAGWLRIALDPYATTDKKNIDFSIPATKQMHQVKKELQSSTQLYTHDQKPQKGKLLKNDRNLSSGQREKMALYTQRSEPEKKVHFKDYDTDTEGKLDRKEYDYKNHSRGRAEYRARDKSY